MTSTVVSTRGGGRNADRGTIAPGRASNVRCQRPAPGASGALHRTAACCCSTRCAATSLLPGATSLRTTADDPANDGLATTRKGRRGRRRSAASVRTTVTASSAKRRRSVSARWGCSSTATTRAPAATRAAVMAPRPAPMSRTSCPGRMAARSTRRSAHSGSSSCQPHRRRDRATTAHRDHEDAHGRSRHHRGRRRQRISAGRANGGPIPGLLPGCQGEAVPRRGRPAAA